MYQDSRFQPTPFHLEAVHQLPSAAVAVEGERVGRLVFVGSDYEAYAMADALDVLSTLRASGGAFWQPELVCLNRPEPLAPMGVPHLHDLWVLHSAVIGWEEASQLGLQIKARDPGARVVLLSDDRRAGTRHRWELQGVDRAFIWHGQPNSLLALFWLIQDEMNAAEEMALGLPMLLVIEDQPVHYSSFLPRIYLEIVERVRALVGRSASPEILREHLRMRPRVLLAQSFEKALVYLGSYSSNLLGVITDLMFPAGRELHPRAGLIFAEAVRTVRPTVPLIVHSTNPAIREQAQAVKAHFLYKRSDRWLAEVRRFMLESFGFGDFIFRDAKEREIQRVSTIRELRKAIAEVPLESFLFHARRYHFSTWLFIHGAYELARRLRPLSGGDEKLRVAALNLLDDYLASSA